MKTKFSFSVLLCVLISIAGCDKGEEAAMQSQINRLQNENDGLSTSNLVLQGKILVLQEKVKSGEKIDALLQQQLDFANGRLEEAQKKTETNVVQDKNKPVEEIIRAFHKFNSIITVSVTFDEYRQGLQELRTVLDEDNSAIEDSNIAETFQDAYSDYQDALIVWGASLGQNLGDFESPLKKHGLWSSQIPADEQESLNEAAKNSVPSVTPEYLYNYEELKYDVNPCLRACSSSAKELTDSVENKIQEQKPQ